MASYSRKCGDFKNDAREMDFIKKYEQILQRRSVLLRLMEERRPQIRAHCRERREQADSALTRNHRLLQELYKMEQRVSDAQSSSSDLQSLKSRYWASLEESVPAWKPFLLGRGPHPFDAPPAIRAKDKCGRTKDVGLPPRPSLTIQPRSSKRKVLSQQKNSAPEGLTSKVGNRKKPGRGQDDFTPTEPGSTRASPPDILAPTEGAEAVYIASPSITERRGAAVRSGRTVQEAKPRLEQALCMEPGGKT